MDFSKKTNFSNMDYTKDEFLLNKSEMDFVFVLNNDLFLRKNKHRSAARVLSRPEAQKGFLIYDGNLVFELGMRRYTCATEL